MKTIMVPMGLPRWLSYKESASKQVMGVWSPSQEDSLEKEMANTPVFLSGQSYGWRSKVDYSPWCRERAGHDLVTEQQQHGTLCPCGYDISISENDGYFLKTDTSTLFKPF